MRLFTEPVAPSKTEAQTVPCLSLAQQLAECESAWRRAERKYDSACATFRKHAEQHQERPLIFCSGSRMNVLMAVASPENRHLRAVVVEILAKRNALLALRANLQKQLGVIR